MENFSISDLVASKGYLQSDISRDQYGYSKLVEMIDEEIRFRISDLEQYLYTKNKENDGKQNH
jgi:hypothetical protein